MREIKFRQPRFDAKGNFVDWFYWGFIDDGSGLHFIAPLQHNVDNYQFTGLKDKNGDGEEIYEGDIVTCTSGQPKVVEFHIVHHQCGFNIGNGYHKIIGNIHQNPELMEKDNG